MNETDNWNASWISDFGLSTVSTYSSSSSFSPSAANNSSSSSSAGHYQIPLYTIIFLLAVIGNSLVILTLVQNKRMRTITNLFLLNLSVSDLFLGVFCMPFTLIGTLLRDFVFGEIMCKFLPYLQGNYFISLLIPLSGPDLGLNYLFKKK